METRSKRRRIMVSYVSPQRSDLPARFESLNDDTLTTVSQFVGNKSYRSFGGINKHCKGIYLNTPGAIKETFLYGYGTLQTIVQDIRDKIERAVGGYDLELFERVGKGVVYCNRRDVLAWALQERNNGILRGICGVATKEGRIDLLDEVCNNVEDWNDKENIFIDIVDRSAAHHGKLNVLKWLETRGLSIRKDRCAEAAAGSGHIQILQWLQEEQDLELDGYLYYEAIRYSGQLNVMKWLREQEVPWDNWAFRKAAENGNLEILQWLHDEGCPWPEEDDYGDNRVHESRLKPEVIGWLRVNGYSNKIK